MHGQDQRRALQVGHGVPGVLHPESVIAGVHSCKIFGIWWGLVLFFKLEEGLGAVLGFAVCAVNNILI